MGIALALQAPALLNDAHDLSAFDCEVDSLNDWLKRRARANQAGGASRGFVICPADSPTIIAYYCLAAGAVAATSVPGKIKRNMPDPIPVAILGRLAIDRAWQGKGIGKALLRDAILRVQQAAEHIGIRALLVHAISAEAKAFYEAYGFHPLPEQPMTLALGLKGCI